MNVTVIDTSLTTISSVGECGISFGGHSEDGTLVEVVEIDHPWFVGCQFHP